MTHKMKFSLDRYGVNLELVCRSDEGADCRLVCPEGCESWTIEHDAYGTYHCPHHTEFGISSGVKHKMVDSGECHICLWFNDDPSLIPELYDGTEFVIGEHEIVPLWQGPEEGYDWKEK